MQIFLVNKSGGRIEVCAQSMIILGILKLGRRKNIRNVLTSAKKSCDVRLFSLAKLRKKCVMGKSFIAIAFYFYHFGIFVSIPLSHTDAFFGGDPPILEETPPPSRLARRPPIGWLSNLLWIIIFNNSAHFFSPTKRRTKHYQCECDTVFFSVAELGHTHEKLHQTRVALYFFLAEKHPKNPRTRTHICAPIDTIIAIWWEILKHSSPPCSISKFCYVGWDGVIWNKVFFWNFEIS